MNEIYRGIPDVQLVRMAGVYLKGRLLIKFRATEITELEDKLKQNQGTG